MSNPMIFNSDRAFKQLQERGQVTSARSKPRNEEEVWIRTERTGPKKFDAEIYNVEEIFWQTQRNLYQALHNHDLVCGFASVYEWKREIERLNGGTVPNPLYIHHVVRKDHDILKDGDHLIKGEEQ